MKVTIDGMTFEDDTHDPRSEARFKAFLESAERIAASKAAQPAIIPSYPVPGVTPWPQPWQGPWYSPGPTCEAKP